MATRQNKNKVAETLAKNIRRAREARRMTATEVSARIGYRQSTYSEMESGQSECRLSTLLRIAGALQIDWRILTQGIGDVPLPQRRAARVLK